MRVMISFVTGTGSPGATTTALAIGCEWPRTAIVLDVDPAGGDIPAGLGRGQWPIGAGLMDVVVESRTVPVETALRRHVYQPARHSPFALAGFGSIGQAAGVPWERVVGPLARLSDADVLADCGRYLPTDGVRPLIEASDVVVLVTGSSLRAARSGARLVPLLRDAIDIARGQADLSLLVVGPDRPYASAEIAQGCGLPLLGEIPFDAPAAAVWSDGVAPGRGFRRSALQREARRIADLLTGTIEDVAVIGGAR